MALIKFSGIVSDARGSIGGTVFSRNRGGAYIRSRTKPINPNTPGQQEVRAVMAFLTNRWSQNLTATQRDAWNLYAASVVMQNGLGESINLTGFNHFIRSNSILQRTGNTVVNDGPTIFEIPDADNTLAVTASEATQLLSVVFDDSLAWANEADGYLWTFQGTPQNAQRNFFGGPWRALSSIAGDAKTPPTTPDDQSAVFAIAEGQRDWIYARIQRADGRLSQPFRADTFVAA